MTPDPALFDTDPLTVIRDSALFDPEWYLARYPDVARSGMEPAAHFHFIGSGLGRPSAPRDRPAVVALVGVVGCDERELELARSQS